VRSYVRRIVMEKQHQRYITVEEHRRYERARRQFAQLELLGLHAAVYLVYNVTLFLVFGEPSPYRYLWWGLGLIFHALATFAFGARLAAWAEKRIWLSAERKHYPAP
jgi:2TM domain